MWTLRDFVKPFVTAFVITFACVGWAHLMQLSAITAQSKLDLFVDCVSAAAIGTALYPRLTALLGAMPGEETELMTDETDDLPQAERIN